MEAFIPHSDKETEPGGRVTQWSGLVGRLEWENWNTGPVEPIRLFGIGNQQPGGRRALIAVAGSCGPVRDHRAGGCWQG